MKQSTTPSDKLHRWQQISLGWLDKGVLVPRVRTAKESVAVGIQLNLLKASLPHGQFSDRVNAMGISHRTAARYMASARRFHGASEDFFQAVGSASKLFALLPLSTTDSLAKGESVGALTLDGIAQMTCLEIQAAIKGYEESLLPKSGTQKNGAEMFQALCQSESLPTRAQAAEERSTVRLNVSEERMLRRYRKCKPEGQEALMHLAGLLMPA